MGEATSGVIRSISNSSLGQTCIRVLGSRYLAGHSVDEGLTVARKNWEEGRKTSIDILGEAAATVEKADYYRNGFFDVINGLRSSSERAVSISLKPSAICVATKVGEGVVFHERTPFSDRLEGIVTAAEAYTVDVTLDMEDRFFTDVSLDAARQLWRTGYTNFGIVLQSRLYRTPTDIVSIFGEKYPTPAEQMRVRCVIGIYKETPEHAVQDNDEAKRRLIANVETLLDYGVHVEIGTHDMRVVDHLISNVLLPRNIPKELVEFQTLHGVPLSKKVEAAARSAGYDHRSYTPIEIKRGDSTPYMGRRLEESPHIVLYAVNNLVQGTLDAGNRILGRFVRDAF
jgi:proline dehydrogenase